MSKRNGKCKGSEFYRINFSRATNCCFKHADCCGYCTGRSKTDGPEGIIDEKSEDWEDKLIAFIDEKNDQSLDDFGVVVLPDEELSILNFDGLTHFAEDNFGADEENEILNLFFSSPLKGGKKFIKCMNLPRVRWTQFNY